MNNLDLSKDIANAACRVSCYTEQMNNAEKIVLKSYLEAFGDRKQLTILCEPSLARSTVRPPDFVLVDETYGVHVFEIKGHKIDGILSMVAGEFEVVMGNKPRKINPIKQVRRAMFDIKNAAEYFAEQDLTIPFVYWVVFPNITRAAWRQKWGDNCFFPDELIFYNDIRKEQIVNLLENATKKQLAKSNQNEFDSSQLIYVWKCFGDSSPLSSPPEPPRNIPEDTLGSYFDKIAASYKRLSDEQQKLAEQDWSGGPRLIRGVAGSGKTIVLAAHVARLITQYEKQQRSLLGNKKKKILVVCYNRTLQELLHEKINGCCKQRGMPLDDSQQVCLDIKHMNSLFHDLAKHTNNYMWEYQKIRNGDEESIKLQSEYYLSKIIDFSQKYPDHFKSLQYDAIYVDEGQDFLENWFKILFMLADKKNNASPNLFIFYDDAQNLYGRNRPTWERIGIKVTGRSTVMSNCFRNTCEIIETAFNVLVGSFCTRMDRSLNAFADVHYLEKEKNLISREGEYWRVNFATKNYKWPTVKLFSSRKEEMENIRKTIEFFVHHERVNVSDILVLGPSQQHLDEFSDYLINESSIQTHKAYAEYNKDKHIFNQGKLTVSTIHSAKGYDSFVAIILSANEFSDLSLDHRATFYVGCTRARELLIVSGYANSGMFREFSTALSCLAR